MLQSSLYDAKKIKISYFNFSCFFKLKMTPKHIRTVEAMTGLSSLAAFVVVQLNLYGLSSMLAVTALFRPDSPICQLTRTFGE